MTTPQPHNDRERVPPPPQPQRSVDDHREEVRQQNRTPSPQTRRATPTAPAPAKENFLKKISWKVWVGLAAALVLVIVGVNTAPMWMPKTTPATTTTTLPTAGSPVISTTVPAGVSVPTTTWFVTESQTQPSTTHTTLFTTPKSLGEFMGNPPWAWLIWPFFGLAIYVLLRRNRMVASEQSDVKLFHIGILIMISSILLSKAFSVLLTDVFGWLVGEVVPISPELVITFGTIINLAIQVGASMSGKTDWSPLSQGFYISGLIICWFWPDVAVRWTIGLILLMGAGFAIQIYEVKRQDHAVRSFALAIAMVTIVLILKFLLSSLIAFALPLIPQPSDPTIAQLSGMALSLIYRGRIVVSVGLAAFVAFGFGELSATWLLDVASRNNLIQLEGQTQAREDKNTPREDAVILGLMMVQIWWAFVGF